MTYCEHTLSQMRETTCSHTEDMRSWEVLKLSVLVTITTWRHLECPVTMTVMMLSSLGMWLLHHHRCFLSSKHLVTSTVLLPSTPATHQRTWLSHLYENYEQCASVHSNNNTGKRLVTSHLLKINSLCILGHLNVYSNLTFEWHAWSCVRSDREPENTQVIVQMSSHGLRWPELMDCKITGYTEISGSPSVHFSDHCLASQI